MLKLTHDQITTAALLASGAAAISAYLYWSRYHSSDKKAKRIIKMLTQEELNHVEWEHVGQVTNVWIYPVKSCAGISLQVAETGTYGLLDGKVRDRSFAFTTEKGNLIRGSMIGATVLITPVVSDNTLILKHSDVEDLTINLDEVEAEKKESTINIFGDIAPGYDCGDDAALWLEKIFKKKARLLYHSNIPSTRDTKQEAEKQPLMKDNDNSLYADTYPYMLMTKESVADLQARVKCQTPPQNFRPNILVEGTQKPFDEDEWAYVKIGNAIFRNVSPCGRCTFTTVNYDTGIKNADTEPLKTLKKYRSPKAGDSPNFGITLAVDVKGTIRDGDDVYVTRF